MIQARFDRGVFLPAHGFWLDPWDRRSFAFVSHAHSDHIGRHAETVLSRVTARLMAGRIKADGVRHELEFGVTTKLRGMDLTLHPAGHVFGSAQIHVADGGGTLLYTGDFKLRRGLSAEPITWAQADTLIMETTYGLPHFVFPPAEEVIADVVRFCRGSIEDGDIPVLLGYSLGKSQEILSALTGEGLPVMLHKSVSRITAVYEELGVKFPPYKELDPAEAAGHVVICPPGVGRSRAVTSMKNRRVAVLTGWSVDPGAVYRYGCDEAFPLSDHADYNELIEFVELVSPKLVLTLHGYASEFVRDLRARGIEAWALVGDNQLEFSLFPAAVPTLREDPPIPSPAEVVDSPFLDFAMLCEKISRAGGRLRKRDLLSAFLRRLLPGDLARCAVFLTGRPFPQAEARTVQTGWAVLRRALAGFVKGGEARLREISRRMRDAGSTTEQALRGSTKPEVWGFERVEKVVAVHGV